MPYLSVAEARKLVNEMTDDEKDVSKGRGTEWNARQDEARDKVGRFLQFFRYSDDWRPVISDNADSRPS